MKSYYRIMLGHKSTHAEKCYSGKFIGAHYNMDVDLKGKLPDQWKEFNKEFIPVYLEKNPGKSKIAAGLACGMIWTISKGIENGDIVICPDGTGNYYVGEVAGDYYYAEGDILPHRRPIQWIDATIERSDMSQELRNSTGSTGTVCNITRAGYAEEVEKLIGGIKSPSIIAVDETIEDPSAFAMEKHLEDFLVQNWSQTELGKNYDIFEEDGECVGQQYETDTGPLDILAVSKDKKELLVVELKKGRASDIVVGQALRYMGYVQEEIAENGQDVRGIIIALDDDQRIKHALKMTPAIDFYRYQISFKLVKD